MAKTLPFQCRDGGSIPGWGTKIPHAVWHAKKKQKDKREQCVGKVHPSGPKRVQGQVIYVPAPPTPKGSPKEGPRVGF